MLKHETKACPCCGQVFECRMGDVLKCQCYGIELSDEQQRSVAKKYEDCLCRNCLLELKDRFDIQKKPQQITPIVFSWSGGKDSAYALYLLQQSQVYEVKYLLSTFNKNLRRLSMHGVREELIEEQAKQIGLPLRKVYVSESSNEEYEKQMGLTLSSFKEEGINTIAFGDIFLEELRKYREQKNASLGFTTIFPLWGEDTKEIVQIFLQKSFKTITCCVSDEKLNQTFCGQIIDADFISSLPQTVDSCGENGEYHSFCFDGPVFKNEVRFIKGEIIYKPLEMNTTQKSSTNGHWYCELLPVL